MCLADSVLCGRRWFLLLSQINEYTPLSPSFRQKKPTLSPQRKKGFTVLIHTGTHTAQSRCTCTCGKWQISRSLTQYMIPWTVFPSRTWSCDMPHAHSRVQGSVWRHAHIRGCEPTCAHPSPPCHLAGWPQRRPFGTPGSPGAGLRATRSEMSRPWRSLASDTSRVTSSGLRRA